jgi:hypothetical protein
LSQWGQFPIFTGVRISRTGRPPTILPLAGSQYPHLPLSCRPRGPLQAYSPKIWSPLTLSLFFAHTWAFPHQTGRTKAVDTRGRTGPVPCGSSIFLSSVCPCGPSETRDLLRTRGDPQGASAKERPALSAASPHLSVKALSCGVSVVSRRRNDVGPRRSGFLTVFSRRPHHAPGMSSVDTRPPHRERVVPPPSALQTRADPGAHTRPNRDASRSLIAWPLHRRPYGTTLATYLSCRRVRAVTSVRGRTRTGRMWFNRTAPFETWYENPSTHANAGHEPRPEAAATQE